MALPQVSFFLLSCFCGIVLFILLFYGVLLKTNKKNFSTKVSYIQSLWRVLTTIKAITHKLFLKYYTKWGDKVGYN